MVPAQTKEGPASGFVLLTAADGRVMPTPQPSSSPGPPTLRVAMLLQLWQTTCNLQLRKLLCCIVERETSGPQLPPGGWLGMMPGTSCLLGRAGFHTKVSLLRLSGETDVSLQNSRGKHRTIPPCL